MRLYLLRHATAVPADAHHGRRDDDRSLTDEGHSEARRVAAGLLRLKIPVDAVVTSPLVRARQTAQLVARAYGLEDDIRELDALRPEADPAETSAALRAVTGRQHAVLVGHEPHMSAWLSHLVAEGALRCVFKKAGVACVEVELIPPPPGGGALRWFMTPKQLALIGQAK